ncbi:hypothetical protein [Rhizobium rosettiformans]|uniref:hypothetical protein n=1 Tax=Rhizobium rosettiformans TaxID=1368430 RepID=UPI0028671FDC|nr:hypothetical protein [Rhizobium rosettiformans]MDR7027261.1 hypothetical protein [Rhizobium rosettiformans]MDR7065382.1 hypothetical protein [Rhizobium rosettiformans]
MASEAGSRVAGSSDLQKILKKRAINYNLPADDLDRIVKRTIEAAVQDEDLTVADDLEAALFGLLDRFVVERSSNVYILEN